MTGLLRTVVAPTTVVVAATAVAGAATHGTVGGLGALLGGLVTLLFLGSTPGLLGPVARRAPVAALPVALGFFVLKAFAAFVALTLLVGPDGLRDRVDPVWFAAGVGLTSLTWVVLHLRALRRDRTPTYDLDAEV